MVFAKGTQKNMVLNCARSAGLMRRKGHARVMRHQNSKKLPQLAASCYSGSDERCGDSCDWELIPGGKNVGFHDRDRGRMTSGEGRTAVAFGSSRDDTVFCSGRLAKRPESGRAAAGFSGWLARKPGNGRDAENFSSRLAVALSDGMGKGEAAARESERAVNSVLPLLKAGMDPEMALQVLNLLWSMSNRKEMFPTMDLALLDPVSRELVIYKIGAAPTVIVRAPRCRPGRHSEMRISGPHKANEKGRPGMFGIAQELRAQKQRCPADSRQPAADQPGRTGACPQDAEASATCHTKRHRQAPTCSIPPEQIEILTAPAMPMGVSEYSEIPSISTLVMPGDLIIMMTDGVVDSLRSVIGNMEQGKINPQHIDLTQNDHESIAPAHIAFEHSVDARLHSPHDYPELDWLRRLLSRIKSRNLQTICDLIIREAALNYGTREKDDMTVAVIRV